jgi:hypothetical protein
MARRTRLWGFGAEERRVLIDATANIPQLRALVARAQPRPDLGDVWIVQAPVRELDEMYSLVEAMMDATRGRKRLDLLEGLLATLCTSIDGF